MLSSHPSNFYEDSSDESMEFSNLKICKSKKIQEIYLLEKLMDDQFYEKDEQEIEMFSESEDSSSDEINYDFSRI